MILYAFVISVYCSHCIVKARDRERQRDERALVTDGPAADSKVRMEEFARPHNILIERIKSLGFSFNAKAPA